VSEHDIQSAAIQALRLHPEGRKLYAIPNGGKRHIKTAMALKAEGVQSGVPDLFLPLMRGGWGGLYIEVKDGKKGRLTPNHEATMQQLSLDGYLCVVCRSAGAIARIVLWYVDLEHGGQKLLPVPPSVEDELEYARRIA
jgi:hypothetical protein